MRLIAKQENRYVEVFRVNFYKAKDAVVIGEFSLFHSLESLIPSGINFHSHFIYTENGNYHYSIKYYDIVEKVYVDRKTFYNHVAIRKGPSPEFNKTHPYERRNRIDGNPLDMFMMTEPSKPWTERPLNFQFGLQAITSLPNVLIKAKALTKVDLKEDDLIVDLDEHKNKIINFSASISSKDHLSFKSSNLNPEIIVIEKSIEKHDLILRLTVITVPN